MKSSEAFMYLGYILVILVLVTAYAIYNKKWGKQIKYAWIAYAIACFGAGLLD